MTYLSKEELEARFDQSEITELTQTLSSEQADAKITAALDEAEALVNSYLDTRYSLPIAANAMMKRMVADIARFLLFDKRATQEVRERYEDQMKHLKDISSGKANLAGATTDDEQTFPSESNSVAIGDEVAGIDFGGY